MHLVPFRVRDEMMKNLGCILVTVFALAIPAGANDCGQAPLDAPIIPDGTTASTNDIRVARDDVLAYSNKVDAYIACMDSAGIKIAPYLTKEQITRRQDDLNSLHNERRDLQLALNEAIRAFRRQTSSN